MANSLRYNVAQYGSAIPILWGTNRVSPNVLDGFNFKSTGSGSGKGGVAGAGKGKSGGRQYSVNVAFGFMIGPGQAPSGQDFWANAGVKFIGSVPVNWWGGGDGQSPDPVFASSSPNTPVVGYSGLMYLTATPMQLGNSPVLPNISAELTGFRAGSCGADPLVAQDANPSAILFDMLYDPRIGIRFPGVPADLSDWGNYCQASLFGFSLLCDKQQPLSSWVEELAMLTVSAPFWSSGRLRVVPYSVSQLDQNGAAWFPNLTPIYNLTDDDYLPWGAGTQRSAGEKDPVLVKRSDPSQLTNWLTIEIMDRNAWYDPSVQQPVFDQASIDTYGMRTTTSIQAHEICTPTTGLNVANAIIKRKFYLRNTFQFRVGWRYMLLEPMDIVTLTDSISGLINYPVRIIEVQEDDGGALTLTAEELV